MRRVEAKRTVKYLRPERCPLRRDVCWDERRGMKAVCVYYRGAEDSAGATVNVLCSAPTDSTKGTKP